MEKSWGAGAWMFWGWIAPPPPPTQQKARINTESTEDTEFTEKKRGWTVMIASQKDPTLHARSRGKRLQQHIDLSR
jgi:hypothetical protein